MPELPIADALDALGGIMDGQQNALDELGQKINQKDLEIARLRSRLAAYEPAEIRHGSEVSPKGTTRESWLQTRLQASGMKVRQAGRKILSMVWEDPPDASDQVIEALHAMVDEINRWQGAWASTSVDMDRKLREASRAALDCEHHGEIIKGLEAQVTHLDSVGCKAEKGRLALIDGLYRLEQAVDKLDLDHQLDREVPKDYVLIPRLRTVLTKIHEAHKRAWK